MLIFQNMVVLVSKEGMLWKESLTVCGELQACFLHCTLECLHPYVTTTSFRLMALQNKVECHWSVLQWWNKHPTLLLIQKCNKKLWLILYCVKRSILFNTNLITKNNISSVKTVLKALYLNHCKLCEIVIEHKKNILAYLARIFLQCNSF